MDIKPIEEKAYARMRQRFAEFVREMEELCGDPNADNEWMDGQEVCRMLNIEKRTLQYYRDSGKLSYSRIGNKCYYKISDIEILINESYIK